MKAEFTSHISVYFIAVVVLIFTFTLPAPQPVGADVGSYFFPQVLLITILVLNTLSVVRVIYNKVAFSKQVDSFKITKKNIIRVSLLVGLLGAYIILMPIIGYEITTGLFLILMMLMFGIRDYKILILIPIGVVGILYIVFDTLLSIPLP